MKIIQRPFFFLVWSTKLALSAAQDGPLPTSISEYPTCILQGQCLTLAITTYCSLKPTIGCACEEETVGFFFVFRNCALKVCSEADINKALNLMEKECTKRGYNPEAIIDEALAPPAYTFPTPSVVPTSISFTTTMSQTSYPSGTGISNPNTNPNTSSKSSGGNSALSTAAIIGIVIGVVAVIAIIAGLIVFCMKHRAKQQRPQAMTAVPPPPPPDGPQPPPQMVPYLSSSPPGYPPYTAPVYSPQQQPIMQQQQPLMQGYQEPEHPAASYHAATKEADAVSSSLPTTTSTPAPLPPRHQGQYFHQLSAQQRPTQVDTSSAQEGHVFAEMSSDNQRR
ncbi:hypothetical protein EV426DRAFT_576488 [Tirmania nivea]|nr:hypothetical protein EV426DRAFT_576488 [Tirmania nivea]